MFGQNAPVEGARSPQARSSNRLLDYSNSILSHMQDYIIDKIITYNLHFDFPGGFDDVEAVKLRNLSGGLEPMAYFMFKFAYEDDASFGNERIERFDDFSEFLQISSH